MRRKIISVMTALVLAISLCLVNGMPVGANPGTLYVDPSGTDTPGGGGPADPFATIGYAVTQAVAGDTIMVAGGTYAEGQIVINVNLTIIGDASNKPVINPTGDLTGNNAADAWVLINESATFNLSNLIIDGNTNWVHQAIRSHGNTTLNNVDFSNIRGSASGSPYRGIAVENFGGWVQGGAGSDSHGTSPGLAAAHLVVNGGSYENIGRIGILVKGDASTADIIGITYTGKGDGDWLDYAVEAGAGGDINVQNSLITMCTGVASTDGSTSAGILVTEYYGAGSVAEISGNTITGNTDGIAVGYLATDDSTVDAHGNNIYGNEYGMSSSNVDPDVTAEDNWWGSSDGPAPAGSGDEVVNIIVSSYASSKYSNSYTNLTASVPDIVAITVTPTSINYGTIYPGFSSDIKVVTVMNIGTVDANVDAYLQDAGTVFDYLELNGDVVASWGGIMPLDVGTSKPINSQLVVPTGYAAIGTETNTLVFVASTP